MTASGLPAPWRHGTIVSSDEYALLYPRLVPSDGRVAPALLAHLEICVAVRAWRLTRLDPAKPALDLRSGASADAARRHGTWFADDGAVACLLRQMGLLRSSPERLASERRLLALLDDTLNQIQRGFRPAGPRTATPGSLSDRGSTPPICGPKVPSRRPGAARRPGSAISTAAARP